MQTSIVSKVYKYEWVKSLKNRLRPLKQRIFGKSGIYIVMEKVAERAGGRENVKLVYDLGALDGEYTLHFAEYFPNAIIHSFEPNPVSLPLVYKRQEKYPDRIIVHPVAISSKKGSTTYYRQPSEGMGTLIPRDNSAESFPVETNTLDSEYAGGTIDLLKIDVEGFEWEVLQGAEKTLKNTNAVFVEIDPIYKNFNGDDAKTISCLRNHFPKVERIDDLYFSR